MSEFDETLRVDIEGMLLSARAGKHFVFHSGRRAGRTLMNKTILQVLRDIEQRTAEDATFENEFRLQ